MSNKRLKEKEYDHVRETLRLIIANLAIYIKILSSKCDFVMKLYFPSAEGKNISQAGMGKSKVYIKHEKGNDFLSLKWVLLVLS